MIAFLTSAFSFIYLRSYLKRRTGQERILSEIREEVNGILRSIDETTDRDISLIEEREKNLKSLLEDIDKRLKIYIREMEQRREADEAYAALTQPPQKTETVSPEQSMDAYLELGKNRYRVEGQEIPEEDESEGESTGSAFPLPRFRIKQPGQVEATESPIDVSVSLPVGEQILELVRAGFTPPVIASRLGLSIAEVEFATALLERRDAL